MLGKMSVLGTAGSDKVEFCFSQWNCLLRTNVC